MKLALSMWSVHRTVREKKWTALDFLSFCKDEGIGEVELLDVFWTDVEGELPTVVNFASDNGISIVSYAVGNDFVKPDEGEREAALNCVLEGITVAKRLGVSVVRVFAGDVKDGLSYDDGREWIIDGLKKASEVAEREQITLCLENHGQFAGRSEQVKEIIEQVGSDALRSTFDVGNFLLVDEDPINALAQLLPYVKHVHMKDFKSQEDGRFRSLAGNVYEGVSVNEGDVDVTQLLQQLKEDGYNGAIVLEYEGIGDETEGIRRGYENFNHIVKQL